MQSAIGNSMIKLLLAAALAAPFSAASAQQIPSAQEAIVPRLIQFSGTLKDSHNKPFTGTIEVTFSIYATQEDGTPLWTETQEIAASTEGNYAVLLGAASPTGVPAELFSSGGARWLAIQTPEQPEGPRVLLVSVPYALKAADADTLGGKPASAFVMAEPQAKQANVQPNVQTPTGVAVTPAVSPATTPTGSGTTDYIPLWTSSTNLGNSLLYQGSGYVKDLGIFELPSIGTATASTGYNSEPFYQFASAYNSSTKAAVVERFSWQVEPAGNNTASPSGKLNLLFASGIGAPAETGFSIGSTGVITSSGNVSASQLTSTVATGTAPLKVASTTQVANLNASYLGGQPASAFASLAGANVFTATNYFPGGLSSTTASSAIVGRSTNDADFAAGIVGQAWGSTKETIGVEGITSSPAGAGVYGGAGSTSSTGTTDGGYSGVWADTGLTAGSALTATADDGYAGYFVNNSPSRYTLLAQAYGAGSIAVFESNSGSCSIGNAGSLSCTGTKSAVVPVDNGTRKVALYAVESPENWFEDFGSGQLTDGKAIIRLEATFAQTVNAGVSYHVFITPRGESKGLYVSNATAEAFEVHEAAGGKSNIEFDYRIVARRKGYEDVRLADKTKEFDSAKGLVRRK